MKQHQSSLTEVTRYPDIQSFRTNITELWQPFKTTVKAEGMDCCFVLNSFIKAFLEYHELGQANINQIFQTATQHLNANTSNPLEHAQTINLHIHNHYIVRRPTRQPGPKVNNCRRTISGKAASKARRRLLSTNLDSFGMDSDMMPVVVMLLKHYVDTGSKYVLVKNSYELAERCKASSESMPSALRKLTEDNIIYVFSLPQQGLTKIGLKIDFMNALIEDAQLSKRAPAHGSVGRRKPAVGRAVYVPQEKEHPFCVFHSGFPNSKSSLQKEVRITGDSDE